MRAMPGGFSVAGQGFQRREILRIMGAAAVASHFPGFSRWAYAEAHARAAGDAPRPAVYTPLFFNAAEFAIVTRLAELIIPSDETPGAREAGAAEFVDFMVAHDVPAQPPMRDGIAWLQNRCRHEFKKGFLELTEARQIALLETLAYRLQYRKKEERGQEFFGRVRDLTVMGFYSSQVGYRELDNPALQYYPASPACPHVDDRAHVHLPPAKW
jgi:gluconate 2-dehydrogenase gamma chain